MPIVLLVLLLGIAAEDRPPPLNGELSAYLTEMAGRLADPARPAADRLRLAQDAAATLDRAARAAPDPADRRALWERAARFLDDYARKAPEEQRPALTRAAATLRWAVARSWLDQFRLAPTETAARDEAARGLDTAIASLQRLPPPAAMEDEARYRLAYALADRAEIDADPTLAASRREAALGRLEPIPPAPAWQGFFGVLRASLLRSLDRREEALAAIAAARTADPPPPVDDAAPLQARILADLGRFDEAEAILARETLSPAAQHLARLDLFLAQRARAGDPRHRFEAEAAACAEAAGLDGPEGWLGRIRLAEALPQPDPDLPASALEVLGEGAMRLGRKETAARRWIAGAQRAGDDPRAFDLRYRAAAALFEAGRPEEARPLLAAVRDNPRAGPLRARAGLLLALVEGRPGGDAAAYVEALKAVVRVVPDDPLAGEARLRLGSWLARHDQIEAAEAAWGAIPPENPAWLPAQRAGFARMLDELESMTDPTEAELTAHVRAIERFLDRFQAEAPEIAGRVEAGLARARFELSDRVDRPAEAAAALERIGSLPLLSGQRTRWRGRRVALDLRQGRFADAERRLPELLRDAQPDDLREIAADLSRAALRGSTDLQQRRTGSVLQAILAALRRTAEPSDEIDLMEARAQLARGDAASAATRLQALDPRRSRLSDAHLGELAETWLAARDPGRARLALLERNARQMPGSRPWFESRYRLARLAADAGRAHDARRLIEATSLLHPELGGDGLRGRFLTLEKRLRDTGQGPPRR